MTDIENKEVKITKEGLFIRWREIMHYEGKPEQTSSTSSVIIPGVEISNLLRPHVGKKVRIIIEVLEEL